MPCLQCGKTLAFLKRWSDAEFCCAEHRETYTGALQQSMLSRLQASGERLRRLTEPPAEKTAPRLPVLAGFLPEEVLPVNDEHPLKLFPARFRGIRPSYPRLPSTFFRGKHLAGYRPDLPWPYYNSTLLICRERILTAGIASSEALRSTTRLTGRWNPFRDRGSPLSTNA